jgi:hypothetical protein
VGCLALVLWVSNFACAVGWLATSSVSVWKCSRQPVINRHMLADSPWTVLHNARSDNHSYSVAWMRQIIQNLVPGALTSILILIANCYAKRMYASPTPPYSP